MRATVTWTVSVDIEPDEKGKEVKDNEVAIERAAEWLELVGPDSETVQWEED